MKQSDSLAVCVSGIKGLYFLKEAITLLPISQVYSYQQTHVHDDTFNEIAKLCKQHNIACSQQTRISENELSRFKLCYVIGWQYLLETPKNKVVIFHDSLLPKYRGFSPTVSALIAGEDYVGVSAIIPERKMDAGPILKQERLKVEYPATIDEIYISLAPLYSKIAQDIWHTVSHSTLSLEKYANPQDETNATYSPWRGKEDQWINWSQSSSSVQRFVNALGWPYTGARTRYDGIEIIVQRAETTDDINFSQRFPGKVWEVNETSAKVICGEGLLKITRATSAENGELFTFGRLRAYCK